jgi:hypothetical protein
MFWITVSMLRHVALYAAFGPVAVMVVVSAIDFDTVRQYLLEADADGVQSVCLQLMLFSALVGVAVEVLLPTIRQAIPLIGARRSQHSAMAHTSVDQPQRGLALRPSEYYVRELWRRDAFAAFEQTCEIKDLMADLASPSNSAGSDLLDHRVLKAMNCRKTGLRPTQSAQDAETLAAYRRDGVQSQVEGMQVTTIALDNGQCRADLTLGPGYTVSVRCAYSQAAAITNAVLTREIEVHRF